MFVAWFLYVVGVLGLGYWVYSAYTSGSDGIVLAIICFIIWTVFGCILMISVKN